MSVLSFWVSGRPVPKERARTVRTKHGKHRTFTPPRTVAWETSVRLAAQAACSAVRWKPVEALYAIDVVVHRARKAGDGNNFLKAAKDALNGVVWPDDRMVWRSAVTLRDDDEVGMQVVVERETAHEARALDDETDELLRRAYEDDPIRGLTPKRSP